MAVQLKTTTRYGGTTGPLALAHRGGAGLAPENTIEAFARSYALGIRYLETDVQLTRDGVPVVFHDQTLDRVTDGVGPVNALDYGQLRELRVAGHRIPRLEWALRAFPDACFTIDIKDPKAIEPVADVLRRTGAQPRVCVAGSWDSNLFRVRDLAGDDLSVALGWRALFSLITGARVRMTGPLLRPSGFFAHVPLRLGRMPIFEKAVVERAHDLGIRVLVWTVNDVPTMNRLLDHGVDGIFTDRPDLLRDVLIARGQWTSPYRHTLSSAS